LGGKQCGKTRLSNLKCNFEYRLADIVTTDFTHAIMNGRKLPEKRVIFQETHFFTYSVSASVSIYTRPSAENSFRWTLGRGHAVITDSVALRAVNRHCVPLRKLDGHAPG
jgi:hypothetical protein